MIDTWQKAITFFLILILPLFILANFTFIRMKKESTSEWRADFIPKDAYLPEKPFVFLIYGTNNTMQHCEQNLSTIFQQKYENYRIIYIMSGTNSICKENIEQCAAKEGKISRLTILESANEYSTPNLLEKAMHTCKDEEIVVQIANNDWLAHENVLIKLNSVYSSSEEIWLTYCQYLEYPSYKKGSIEPYLRRVLRSRNMQKTPWISSSFKTYYAGLFKQLKPTPITDKKKSGVFDSYLLPLAEGSKNHILYIDDILYIHNTGKEREQVQYNTDPPKKRHWEKG